MKMSKCGMYPASYPANVKITSRTGAKVRRIPVKIPADIPGLTIGYGKLTADPGDVLCFKLGGSTRIGRVVGRVDAPADGPNVPAVSGFIYVIMLSERGDFCHEFWVDPETVVQCSPPSPNFFAYFASADPMDLAYAARYGSASASSMDWGKRPSDDK